MGRVKSHKACKWFLGLLVAVTTAWPQASSTTVRGIVRDQAQGVVPKASVTLTNTATNVARSTITNDAGLFVFPGVFPGPYRVVVEFPGMQKYEANLTVQVQQDVTVDVTLQVGQTVTQVEVRDVTPLLISDRPTLGHTLERQRIEQLPINGRSFSALLATVPGIEFGNSNASGRVQAYGMRVNTSTTIFDGAPVNEIWEGYNFGRAPGLDSLQEMRVETSTSSAKFSRPNTIILTSKSGTNQFHGALFETNRNNGIWVARRRQDDFTKAPFLNRNEFGFSAGGPVYLPKIYNGRNRTFFFAAYEASRSVSYATSQYSVPTEAMRNGDFRDLRDSQGRQIVLYDPLTTDPRTWARQPLSYRGVSNMIDPARITKLAKFLFDVTPLPNLPNVNPLVDVNLSIPIRTPRTEATTTLRIDHRFSDKDLIFGRFSYGTNDHELNITPMLPTTLGDYPRSVGTSNRHWPNHTGSLTWVHTFSPTMTNELLLNVSRDYHWRGSGDRHTNYTAAVGLPNPFQAFNWPSMTDMDLGAYPFGSQLPFWLITNYGLLQDNATKIHGRHEFEFGFYSKYEIIDKSATSNSGPFSSNTLATALYDPTSTPANPQARPLTGFGLANFELGVMNYSAMFRRPWFHIRRPEYSMYFQDNWKVTPRLTLNLGLRYEIRLPAYDKDGTALAFDFARHALVVGTDIDEFIKFGATSPAILTALRDFGGNIISYKEAGLPQKLAYINWKEFSPRLGFAYRAFDGKKSFVVRSGYRISYYPMRLQEWILGQSDSVPVGTAFQSTVSSTALSPDGLPNYGLRSIPQYIAGVNTPDSIINTNDTRLLARGFGLTVRDPRLSDGRVQDWNFTLEKEVMADTVARLGYVGNHGDKQQQAVRYNDSTPAYIWYATKKTPLPTGEFASVATRPYDQRAYGDITVYMPVAYGNYHGMQFELERRFSRGFAYQLLWNFGNSIWIGRDNVDVPGTDTVPSINTFLPGAVPADFDARLRFLNYARGPNTLKHQIRWNFLADLPFGRGKALLGNSKGIVQHIVAGWQVAGLGSTRTSYWTLPTSIYPTTGNPIEVYGYKYPIQDCQTGTCYPGYLWWNGYIPANKINSVGANGRPNGIMGVPANYKPAAAPLIPWGQTSVPANAPAGTNVSSFWDTNNVWIPLSNGTVQRVVYNDNLHPWRNQYRDGPWQWFQDVSAFKFWNLTERVTLRFNLDFFNMFNHPNNPTAVADTGILSTRNSGSPARVTQLGLRLSW
jgi:hypothetical protein